MAKLPIGLYSKDGVTIKVRKWLYIVIILKYLLYRVNRLWIN